MVYELELSQTAKKNLDSLQKDIGIRILKKLREITTDPNKYIKSLAGSELFSLRIGDYRALVIISSNKIFVVKIGYRKDIYDF